MDTDAVEAADDRFFTALLAADPLALDQALTQDFVLVDVMAGGTVPREALIDLVGTRKIDLVGTRKLEFLTIARDPADRSVRLREGLSVVVGTTRITMRYEGQQVTTDSRYTHVFVLEDRRWRLLTAQGTQIVPDGG
jgi:ketosteroid isomerase-like protein